VAQGWRKVAQGWRKVAQGWRKVAQGWRKVAQGWRKGGAKVAQGWRKDGARMAQRKVTVFESVQIRQFSFNQAKILNTYASDTNLLKYLYQMKTSTGFMQIFVTCANAIKR
jgi:hypothetical protein